jgi:hypothetical protein
MQFCSVRKDEVVSLPEHPPCWCVRVWRQNYAHFEAFETRFSQICGQRSKEGRETAFAFSGVEARSSSP